MVHAKDVEKLRSEIVRRYDRLSPRLKQVAQFVLDHPNDMGLQTLAVIAERCKVQPSTVVRFAKAMGYEGASDMQKLFRDELLAFAPSPSYADRIRQFSERAGEVDVLSPHDLMQEFADSNIIALEHLKESIRRAEQSYSVVRIDAEGRPVIDCAHSAPEAVQLSRQPALAPVRKWEVR